jgi:hypothetical protein
LGRHAVVSVGAELMPARSFIEIGDCSNWINLEFELDSELDVENSLHKVDVLVDALIAFRAGHVEEAPPLPGARRRAAQPQRFAVT